MSVETLADVAMMHVDLFSSFSPDRMEFLINSLIDNVVPVLLFRAKKSFIITDRTEQDQNYILKLLINAAIPKMILAVVEQVKEMLKITKRKTK